jgi:hypothetical protein
MSSPPGTKIHRRNLEADGSLYDEAISYEDYEDPALWEDPQSPANHGFPGFLDELKHEFPGSGSMFDKDDEFALLEYYYPDLPLDLAFQNLIQEVME